MDRRDGDLEQHTVHGWRRLAERIRRRTGDARFARVRALLRPVGPVLLVALILSGFGIAFASQTGRGGHSVTADKSTTATAIPSATATTAPATPTPTAASQTAPASATHQPSGTSASAPSAAQPSSTQGFFGLESVSFTPDPSDNFTHTCPAEVYETVTATLTAFPGGTGQVVSYSWYDSYYHASLTHNGSVTFAAGETTKTITFQQGFNAGLGDGKPLQVGLSIHYPDEWLHPTPPYQYANVAFTCMREISNLTFTPSVTSWNAPCGTDLPITFTWSFDASPGPAGTAYFDKVTESSPGFGTWWASGWGADIPLTTGPDQPNTVVSGTISDDLPGSSATNPNGTYWMQVATNSPQVLTARATVTKAC